MRTRPRRSPRLGGAFSSGGVRAFLWASTARYACEQQPPEGFGYIIVGAHGSRALVGLLALE